MLHAVLKYHQSGKQLGFRSGLTFHILSGLIWGKTVNKGYQQTTLVGKELNATKIKIEPVHEISNNLLCATSNASDQPAQTRSLIRAFASRLSIL